MDRTAGVGLAVYAALVASLATPLYDPLSSGEDDWWALLVLLAFAHLGVGAAVGRWWALLLAVAVSFAAFLLGGAEELAWLALILGMPALVACTAIGVALRRVRWIAAGGFVIAALPALWGAAETSRRGEHVPASLERRLPIELSLGNLCPEAETEPEMERRLRRQTEVLIRELGRRPDDLVTFTDYDAQSADEDRREITIRELAQEQLADIEAGGPNCAPQLERRIRAAL
jgi:hypothetical protein